ncbi:MAG: tRNA (adenosine(37)-N6)-threonylcarbamoyltransferase complex transferase subunit TsaD, partial [Patescibacteria group bacterium]
ALIVSGGHTELVLMKNLTQFKSVGGTRDDAVGEAFDKAAKILGLGYPGGPVIARIAKKGTVPKLPRPMIDNGLEMSFSGLKTALSRVALSSNKSALAHEFQEAIVEVLVTKVNRAIKKYHPAVLLLAGGVAANPVLRERLKILAKIHKINYFMPEIKYCADNAAMVALAAYYLKNTEKDLWYNIKVKTNSDLTK